MLTNNYICGLDIGSSKISAAVALIKRRHIENIFFETLPSRGIERGAVVDSIELVGVLGEVLKNLKAKSAINIKFVYPSISGEDIVTKHSHAIIPLAEHGNKVITPSDIQRAIEQARILGCSLEEEIIHKIPFSYAIDSRSNIVNPLGLYSHRLEVDLYLVCVKLPSVQSLNRAINQAGYEIKDLFISGLAEADVILHEKAAKEGITILCDIGKGITQILIFRDASLKGIEVLPVGGDDLTKELANTLKIPLDLAEDVKRSYAIVGDFSQIKEDKEILVKKDDNYKPLKHRLVAEITTAKAELLCAEIKNRVEKLTPLNEIDNFFALGRTVLLEGFLETLENTLSVPVRLGRINHSDILPFVNTNPALSGQNYLNYLVTLGIICRALHKEQRFNLFFKEPAVRNPVVNVINKFKDLYQEYF
ncbi:MAG: cell division protein FtsA [Candidatus Omnitrophica bacterium]|nr:cell division protein FtsA [Candidatus Omnitrophota bacterium]